MASIMDGERQFHIRTIPDEVGRYVIMPGDPGRVPKIAALLDDAKQVAQNREYNVYTGYLDGEKVTVCSTGIGTSGGMDLSVSGGDLVIASAAVRGEGTSKEYLPEGYPAVADFTVTTALAKAAAELSEDKLGKRYHVGVVHSKDSFYGEVEPDSMPVSGDINYRWDAYLRCGCMTSEMECAAVFSVGITRHVRCGAVITAIWNVERSKADLEDNVSDDTTRGIHCAVNAVKILIEQDKK